MNIFFNRSSDFSGDLVRLMFRKVCGLNKLIIAAGLFSCFVLSIEAQNMTTVAGILGDSSGAGNSIGVPNGVAVDSSGNIYTASTGGTNGSTIYKITTGGVRTIYAGVFGVNGNNGDGVATASQLNSPLDLWFDSSNNLYIADSLSRLIRKVTPAGAMTTVAGVLGDSSGAGNSIGIPNGVAVDSSGNIYTASTGGTNGSTIYKITPGGVRTIYAGVFGVNGNNGDGVATASQLNSPLDLWIKSGNIFIADSLSRLIRRVGGIPFTAASVNVSGRITSSDGNPISRAVIVIINGNGEIQYALTNPFGYYNFRGIVAGETYIFQINHKRYQFESHLVNISDELTNLDFTALP